MKRRKSGNIGIVIGDGPLRAAQFVDGRAVTATIPADSNPDNLKRNLRQLLAAAPFAGRNVAIGIEGSDVLIESLVIPAGHLKSARQFCLDRLKGDPVFSAEHAQHGVSIQSAGRSDAAPALAVLAAIHSERLTRIMEACRELELGIEAVEAAPLSAWRAWGGEGVQARLLRGNDFDVVLAGRDDRLLFCRIIPGAASHQELGVTLARAASLLGEERFDRLSAHGLSETDMQILSSDLGLTVVAPTDNVTDPQAWGLASSGETAIDFTPPEERVLREKRRVRNVRVSMAGVTGALVLAAGIVGTQQKSALESEYAALQTEVSQLRETKAQLDKVQATLEQEQANESVISLARPGHRMSTLFETLAESATENVALESIKIEDNEDGGVTAGSRVLEIKINGLAANGPAVRAFSDELLSSGAFREVRVDSSERVLLGTGAEGERFRIYARAETR